jgi:putative membrane protein
MPIGESLRGTLILVSNIATGLVIIIHFYFLILEMFLWSTPFGLRVFRQTLDRAQNSSALAANQGLYNGFLAAGLIWALCHPQQETGVELKFFFLSCVIVAGLFGGYTVSYRIVIFQALPAAIAISLLLIGKALA